MSARTVESQGYPTDRKEPTDNLPPVAVPPPAGRGLLQWEAKTTPTQIAVHPWQICEVYAGNTDCATAATQQPPPAPNRLYHGDNLAVLAHLLHEGWGERFRLVYIDPPFDSGLAYAGKVRTRGPSRRTLGQVVQYRDIWPGDAYLQFMYTRLLLLRPLLAPDGVLWLHCDYRQAHRLQLILEEVFGADNYLNTIAWRSQVARGAKVNAFYFPNSTHFLHVFAKDRRASPVWHPPRKRLTYTRRQAAAQYMEDEQGFFRTSDPGTYSFSRLQELHAAGRLYAPFGGEVRLDPATQTFYCTQGGNLAVKYYLTREGPNCFRVERAVDNLWDDIPGLGTTPGEEVGYPTQKTEALLERVIGASTNPGDWVLDCFMGSGTTPTVAQRMGRRWVACDAGYGAVQTTRRRLYGAASMLASAPAPDASDGTPPGASASRFNLYRPHTLRGPTPLSPGSEPGQETSDVPPGPVLQAELAQTSAGVQLRLEPVASSVDDAVAAPWLASDWRGWIETVEIDPCYDGSIFCPQIVDAPQKRSTMIEGVYMLATAQMGAPRAADPSAKTPAIAVRVTQVSGREQHWVCARPGAETHNGSADTR